jgi:hypothetical protein
MKRISHCFLSLFLTFCLSACTSLNALDSAKQSSDQLDLIVTGDYVISMDEAGTVYENGAIAIDEGLILAIGPAEEILAAHSAAETLGGEP